MKSLRKIFNIVSAAVLLASFYSLLFWNRLEGARIPTRFGIDGMPDSWGNMTSLLILCVIATAAYVFFLACQRARCFIRPSPIPDWRSLSERRRPCRPGFTQCSSLLS